MKNKINKILIVAGVLGLLLVGVFALAISPNDVGITQRNSDNDGNIITFIGYSADGSKTSIGMDGSTTRPFALKFGTGLSIDASNTLNVLPQSVSTSSVSGLQALLDAKADISHTHPMSDIISLITSLAGKSDIGHSHIIADTTGLQTALNAKATTSSLSSVAFSGNYFDLSNRPASSTQPICYEGTTARLGCMSYASSTIVSGGVAAFNLTTDGTSGGTPLFPNGVILNSANPTVSDATASYQMSWAFTNSNKTVTITVNKLTTANILTGILGQTAGNGSVVRLTVWGYYDFLI